MLSPFTKRPGVNDLCKKYFQVFFFLLFAGLTQSSKAQIFIRQNDPTVSNAPRDWRSVSIFDYDNNYTQDLIGGNGVGSNGLFVQSPSTGFVDSSFKNFVLQSSASDASFWADIDNDCDLDVFWPASNGSDQYLYINQGKGQFIRNTSGPIANNVTQALSASWFDYNNDGLIDLFVPSSNGDTNLLLRNDGNLNFTRIDTGALVLTKGRFWTCAPADFDNDGDIDIFLGNRASGKANALFTNNGNGWFIPDTTSSLLSADSCQTASWVDYDNDGWLDLFIGRREVPSRLYKNNGNGTFTNTPAGGLTSSSHRIGGAVWADFDNDGDQDVFLPRVGNFPNTNFYYQNNSNGTFTAISAGPPSTEMFSTESANAADINNDGFPDLIVPNRSQPISLFLYNSVSSNNHYLKLNLHGSSSNKSAIGSRIQIYSSSGTQMRFLGGTSGWRTQQPMEIHFGLDQDTVIDSMKIYWPGGGVCRILNVKANASYNISQLTCSLDTLPMVNYQDSTSFLSAHFQNNSTGPISNFEWNFGDGTSSTAINPVHKYSQAGTYKVKLKLTDIYCKEVIYSSTIEICPDTSKLGFSSIANSTTVSFTDTSISKGFDFFWDFGDGNTAQGASANHSYNSPGTYQVCLTVTDSCRTKNICRQVKVCNDSIKAAFGTQVNGFNISLHDSTSNVLSVSWDFGDGTGSNIAAPTHTYSSPGRYVICQTVSDSCNVNTTCDTVAICLDTAQASFTALSTNTSTMTFQNTSLYATSYLWDFGDGNLSTLENPVHNFFQNGSYEVCLIVSNDCYSDTICKTVNICPAVGKAAYTIPAVLTGLSVQFKSNSRNASSYHWDFNDGSFSSLENPLKTFNSAWYFNVCLTVTDSCGKRDTACRMINLSMFDLMELETLSAIKVYPNPTKDVVKIEVPTNHQSPILIELYSINGKCLDTRHFESGVNEMEFDLSIYPKGLYHLSLTIDGSRRSIKISKY